MNQETCIFDNLNRVDSHNTSKWELKVFNWWSQVFLCEKLLSAEDLDNPHHKFHLRPRIMETNNIVIILIHIKRKKLKVAKGRKKRNLLKSNLVKLNFFCSTASFFQS